MATPLHDADVLVSLAEAGPGAARDWASVRLALFAPERFRFLPEDEWDAATCLALGVPRAVEAVLERLCSRPDEPGTPVLADLVAVWGALPDDPEPWIDAARRAVRGDGREGDLWLARLLADLGGLDGDSLAAATRVDGPDAVATLPGLVLRFAHARGGALEPLAKQLAGQLGPRLAAEPGLLPFALAGVGLPNLLVSPDLDEAAAVAARLAGVEAPRLRARGSARSRARRAVHDLVDGLDGPAPALLRALSEQPAADAATLVGAAAWLASSVSGEPVDVVLRGGGEDRRVLSAARRAVSEAHEDGIADGLRSAWLRVRPASALAAARLAGRPRGARRATAAHTGQRRRKGCRRGWCSGLGRSGRRCARRSGWRGCRTWWSCSCLGRTAGTRC